MLHKNTSKSERCPFTVVDLRGNVLKVSDSNRGTYGNIEERPICFDDVADEYLMIIDTETDARFFCHAEKMECYPFPNMVENYLKLSITGKGYTVSCDIEECLGVFIMDTNTLKMSACTYNMCSSNSNDCTSSLLSLTEIGITVENIKILSAIINIYMGYYRRKYLS